MISRKSGSMREYGRLNFTYFFKKRKKNTTQFHELLSLSSNQAFQKWFSLRVKKAYRLAHCTAGLRVHILHVQ